MEAIRGLIADVFTDADSRAGGAVADWMRRLRDGLVEGKDWSLELTAAGPGGALWREMKENARLASEDPDKLGGMQLMGKHAAAAVEGGGKEGLGGWERHGGSEERRVGRGGRVREGAGG